MAFRNDPADRGLNRATKSLLNKKARAAELAAIQENASNLKGARVAVREMGKALGAGPKHRKPIAKLSNPDLMTDDQIQDELAAILRKERYDWRGANARPEQLFPEGAVIWLLLAGRGFGKTRASAEAVREICETPGMSVAVVAKDHRALRDVCFEGKAGLTRIIPPELVKKYHKGLGDVSLELTNGSVIRGYTAMEPDAVRGQAFDAIWGDEFAAWPKNRADDMLKQLRLCMRESKAGAICILSTTPKRIPHVVNMVKLAEDPEEHIVITRGRSRDNVALNEEWHRQMERDLGGTRLGRQELDGELVLDAEKALWSGRMIDECRWDPQCKCSKDICECDLGVPKLLGVMTGVDPSGSKDGDATGIVTAGWYREKGEYILVVLENKTRKGDPGERYRAVCMSAFEHGAGEIIYESSYGGDNAAYAIAKSWEDCQREGLIPEIRKCPPIRKSTITGDKAVRAHPIVLLYEQQMNRPEIRRIYHLDPTEANGLASLEDEMLSWETDAKKSPNAIDALVHCTRQIRRKLGLETTISSAARSSRRIPGQPGGRQIRGGYNPYG